MSHPTVLDYARYYGLAIDHHADLLKQIASFDQEALSKPGDCILSEDTDQQNFRLLPNVDHTLSEIEPHLTPYQTEFLQNIISPPPVIPEFSSQKAWQRLLPDHRRVQKLYIDEPLLYIGQGDVQKDVERVKRGGDIVASLNNFLKEENKKVEHVDTFENIGTGGKNSIFQKARPSLKADISNEKLSVSTTALLNLDHVIRSIAEIGKSNELLKQSPAARGNQQCDTPLTLLAVDDFNSDDDKQYSSSRNLSRASSASLASKTVSSFDDDIMNVEDMVALLDGQSAEAQSVGLTSETNRELVAGTILNNEPFPLSTLTRHIEPNDEPKLSTRAEERRRKSSEVEEGSQTAVSPRNSIGTNIGGGISSSELTESLKSQKFDLLTALETEVDLALQPVQHSGMLSYRSTEHSGGVGADVEQSESLHRDDACSGPEKIPQHKFPFTDTCRLREEQTQRLHAVLSQIGTQPHMQQGKERKMNWNPFKSVSVPEDHICELEQENSLVQSIIACDRDPVSSDKLLWKPNGIIMLQGSDSESDNERMSVTSVDNNETLCKPQLNRDESGPETKQAKQSQDSSSVTQSSISLLPDKSHINEQAQSMQRVSAASHETGIDTISSLSNFLDLRGKKFSRAKDLPRNQISELIDDPIELTQSTSVEGKVATGVIASEEFSAGKSGTKAIRPEPCLPAHEPLTWHRAIVVNNAILTSNPRLVPFCKRHGSSMLTMVHRDFHTVIDSTCPDIVLGPDSCLMITSIQSLRQRSLPGQKRNTELSDTHQRIMELSAKYELVIVLVIWQGMTSSDSTAITELAAFCSSASNDNTVTPVYIPHHHPSQLDNAINAWVWKCISEHAFPTSAQTQTIPGVDAISLIQDETVWELFLRRAHLNVVAAQIVLNLVQKSEGVGGYGDNGRISGLRRFLRMSLSERTEMLAAILGIHAINSINAILGGDDAVVVP